MKTKARKKITSLLVATALVIAFVAPTVATRVQAAKIGSPSNIVVDHTGLSDGSTIMFGVNRLQSLDSNGNPIGTPDGNPIKWRVVANDGTTITLMADKTLGNRRYDASGHQLWSGSDICNYLNGTGSYTNGGGFLQSSFSTGERSAMVAQYSTTLEQGHHASDTYTANQTIVLPSVNEMKDTGTWGFTNDTERKLNPLDHWWLRSAGDFDPRAAYVNFDGNVNSFGINVFGDDGIRPALKIHLSSVIFSSSAASGGKPATVGALEAASPPGAEIKLTVLDSTLAGFTAVPTGINGNSITLGYSGVGTTANRISAVVKDNSGEITHVGMLASAPAVNGTTAVELPSGFDPANHKLYIFAETVTLPNYTDYASNLVEVPVQAQVAAPTGLVGVACTNASNNDGKITGLTTDMEYSTDGTSWTAVTGTELTGLSAGNYMVRYKQVYGNTVYLQNPSTTIMIGAYIPIGTVATPTANPAGGQVTAGTTITLNVAESGATIHYTIDSSAPTTTSPVYSNPIPVNSAMTIKAVAVKAGMTDSAIMSENYTIASTPPTTQHTITLGASGDGTVTGGGSYAENSTATVTATPNAGWRFVQWTENGTVVNQSASYSFTVTAARTLTAVFEKNGTKPDPVDPTTYSRSSDGSVGSNKADTSPNLKPAVVGRPFTKAEATKLFNTALAAKPAGQTALSFRAQNYTKVEKAVLAELAALAQKNGVTLIVHFDSVVGKAVTYRLSVNPATIQTDLDLTAKIAVGKLTLPKFPVPVEIAVKMPAGVTMETLKITENGKDITATAKPWLDKNGYLHFTTTGGAIVLGK